MLGGGGERGEAAGLLHKYLVPLIELKGSI